jgi:hypothetical protein
MLKISSGEEINENLLVGKNNSVPGRRCIRIYWDTEPCRGADAGG